MPTYKTAEVAAIIGIHPNTVRLYEKLGLIPKPERLPNGYRGFYGFSCGAVPPGAPMIRWRPF